MLLRLGLRGRRTDDHPVCRKCRFDLVGIYPGAERCTECGNTLNDRTVRIGQRRAMKPLVALGSVTTAIATVAAIGIVALIASGTGWNTSKPTWLLVGEARTLGTSRSGAALTELLSRFNTGNLDDETMKSLVAVALDRQASRLRPWVPEWGEIIETADAAALLERDQLHRYVMNASEVEMLVRPTIRKGDRLPVLLDAPNQRIGSSTQFWIATNIESLAIDGERIGFPTVMPFAGGVMLSARQNTGFDWPAVQLPISTDLEPGEHTVRAEWRGSYIGLGGGGAPGTFNMLPETFVTEATFVVLPEGEDTIELVEDAELTKRLESAATEIDIVDFGFEQTVTVKVTAIISDPSDPELVYDVYLRRPDGKRLRINHGDIHYTNAVGVWGIWASRTVRSLPDGPLDVLLVVNEEQARATLDTTRILGRDFVYTGIVPEVQVVNVEPPSINVAPMQPNSAAFEQFLENAAAMNAAKELEEDDD